MPTAELIGDFGSGVSPIIAEDIVVLVRDQKKDSRIYAFDLATGAIRWEHNRKSPLSYCTPIVWKTSDDQQIVAAGHARIVGYDLKTGTEKWSAGNVPSGCCSSPVIAGNILFFAGGSAGELDIEPQMPSFDSMLGDLDKDKDGALSRDEAEKAFEGFFDNQDANRDGRITRDEWEFISRLYSEGKNSAFALRLGGSGDAGHLVVVSSAKLGERTAATPAIADNTLFIRTEQHLYAFGERK